MTIVHCCILCNTKGCQIVYLDSMIKRGGFSLVGIHVGVMVRIEDLTLSLFPVGRSDKSFCPERHSYHPLMCLSLVRVRAWMMEEEITDVICVLGMECMVMILYVKDMDTCVGGLMGM